MHAAGGHKEIVSDVVTRLSRNLGSQLGSTQGFSQVEVDPVEPEWQPLPHVADDDLQSWELIKETAIYQTASNGVLFQLQTPKGGPAKGKAIIRIGLLVWKGEGRVDEDRMGRRDSQPPRRGPSISDHRGYSPLTWEV